MTKIVKCSCEHKCQDKIYGEGSRLANATGDTVTKYRCTVCGKVH